MVEPAPALEEPGGFLVDNEKRFSESIIWRLQRQYYDANGPAAWTTGTVPSYATSNPYIAQVYAKVVFTYLRDALAIRQNGHGAGSALDPKQPVYIVELGSGSGRFSFLFLKKFNELKKASSLRGLDCRYVMTDFTAHNLKAWSAQPLYKPFLASGQLDFGTFDVDVDHEIKLVGGGVLSAETVKNPLVVLANYAFDTFPEDLFRIESGKISEVRVTIKSPQPHEPDPTKPEIMQQFKSRYTFHPIAGDYYPDPELNRILDHYRKRLADTFLIIPVGGFTAVRRLLEISQRRMLLLSSDKGYTHEDELSFLPGQGIQFHGGALSMMVNYHALGQYFTNQGGVYACTSQRMVNLKTAACILGGDAEQFADTILTFREHADVFTPNDYFTLVNFERNDCPNMSLEHFLGLMKVSHFDPKVVLLFGKDVLAHLPNATELALFELRLALERAWENFFPMGEDLPFLLGRFFLGLKRPQDGIRFNQRSVEMFGDNPATYANMGMCFHYAEDPDSALGAFNRALELNPDFEVAKAWRVRALAELERVKASRRD